MSESTRPPASDEPAFRYTAAMAGEIEARWQAYWARHGTFETPNPSGPLATDTPVPGEKYYVLDMFPYPSGSGLHVGHPLGFIATDVFGRYQRMLGRNVLHAMGFDAFGLPAEQYAVQTGTHPRVTTEKNIERYRAQISRIGLAHDKRRGVATTDVGFYRWTQWIFLQIFNSWYDGEARRARPIGELVAQFEAGTRQTPDGRAWSRLTAAERADVIDGYRLAYISEAPVNWCPGLGTVLANEEVTADGRSERGNYPVFKRSLRQWMMRITAYADRLLEDLDRLDWPEPIKLMQRNWIGRSEGARVRFAIDAADDGRSPGEIEVFTTRPDTLFGATYMVLAPEHPLVDQIVPAAWPAGTREVWRGPERHSTPGEAVAAYRAQAAAKTEVERQSEGRQKTGVFTGAYAVNPVDGERVPVFVADYVLWGYGTGAIMAVPAHDQRDFEFARAFDLPMRIVVSPGAGRPADVDEWVEAFDSYDAQAVNSANAEVSLDGLVVVEAKKRIIAWLEEKGTGTGTITYRLRDWLFSRQRYWGEPFPIVYDVEDPTHAIALPDRMLPLELPEIADYAPQAFDPDDATCEPAPPLARANDWVEVELDLGDGRGVRRYRRETNTMPQWAGSCWYPLRYLDPTNEERFVGEQVERYWMGPRDAEDVGGVDLYVGGAEHAVLHLLYSRFWHKVLYDLGHVSSAEPFRKLFNQGYIQAYAYTDERGVYVPAEQVEEVDGVYYFEGGKVNREYGKMGKSLKNSVTPDEFCDNYGADTLRVYEMSMGPLEVSRPWETKAVAGSFRFLQRVWRNIVDEESGRVRVGDAEPDLETLRALHVAIAGTREDLNNLRFNTAIAKLIVLNNHLTKLPVVPRSVAEALVVMVAPIAPHMAEELWAKLGHEGTVAYTPFPVADPQYLVADEVTCVVQVAGKLRDKLQVPPDISEDALRELALASEGVQRALDGRGVRTVIVRAPKLVNVVPA
ncbi:leucine--tRNA ligase [Actinocrinis puniceicyclus]|uniref:Leucine--tRNA ligase n=1 Tax=Actinocrinis puniceicyclus TaxID=977794 RepID=A0A8J7WU42_9ACTN|nr:leucine--tRNA ligase [Actinocrinis puniceicyclus]MBS2966770.1 leucine--tRNA ligase [Actinocrinis puniceicyclus]